MKLIIGLGNPGKSYEKTRHNIGFMVLDNYLGEVKWQKKYNANYCEENIHDEKVIFIKPLTYMNLSGDAVIQFVRFYKIELKDILVIHDDLDLPIGKYRIKVNSSSGGHNGIKSIIGVLNSNSFARLKIGISSNKEMDSKDYVLQKFSKSELNILDNLYTIIKEIINSFIDLDITEVMNKYNHN